MKRSALTSRTAPLPRGAPLRRTPLAAGTKPLARSALPPGAPLVRGKPLRRTPLATAAAPRDTGPGVKTRRLVYARAGKNGDWPGWCEWPGCTRPRQELHHRLNRKDGGRHGVMAARLNGAAWLLAVCRVHHRLVTSACGIALVRARSMGWVLMEHQDAAATPVLTRHHRRAVLLDDAGGWVVSALTD